MGQARGRGETARWPPWSRAGVDDTACHSVITHRVSKKGRLTD